MKINNFLWGAIAVLSVLCILLFTCNKCNHTTGIKTSYTDTIKVSRDTTYAKIKIDTVYVPQWHFDTLYIPRPVYVKWRGDSSWSPIKDTTHELEFGDEAATPDTLGIVQDWLSKRFYADTQHTVYGNIYIYDTLSHNRIINRRLGIDFSVPMITSSVLMNKRNVTGYIGFSLMGSKINPLYSYGVNLGLQTLNRRIYSIGAKYSIHNELFFEGQIQIPITFKKAK